MDLVQDARFNSNAARVHNRDALKVELETRLVRVDGESLCHQLLEAGIPAGPIYNTAQVVAHPHTGFRGLNLEQAWYRGIGTPIKFSRSQTTLRHLPPRFGQHSREILAEAGLPQEQIEALLAAGVVLDKRR